MSETISRATIFVHGQWCEAAIDSQGNITAHIPEVADHPLDSKPPRPVCWQIYEWPEMADKDCCTCIKNCERYGQPINRNDFAPVVTTSPGMKGYEHRKRELELEHQAPPPPPANPGPNVVSRATIYVRGQWCEAAIDSEGRLTARVPAVGDPIIPEGTA